MLSKHLPHPFFSYGLVVLQFSLIGVLLVSSDWHFSKITISIYAIAIFIGLWAIKSMHFGHFNIIPDPMPNIKLVTTGPYQFIRHPMYFSILLFFLAVVIMDVSLVSMGLYLNLFLVLFVKLSYEEYLLTQSLPDYPQYQSKTKRLIPFIL